MKCFTDEELERHARGKKWFANAHLKSCDACNTRLAEIRDNLVLAEEFSGLDFSEFEAETAAANQRK
jgi:hypothetical protein